MHFDLHEAEAETFDKFRTLFFEFPLCKSNIRINQSINPAHCNYPLLIKHLVEKTLLEASKNNSTTQLHVVLSTPVYFHFKITTN